MKLALAREGAAPDRETDWDAEGDAGEAFPPFACAAIIGVGMMGGSLALALKARGLARRVVGADRNDLSLQTALNRQAIDAAFSEPEKAAGGADFVALAAPVGAIPGLLEAIAPYVRPDALITDLGSVKARIVETGGRLLGPRFVGGHPMAGSERSGVEAAQADLFAGAAWAVVRSQPFALASDPPAARLAALIAALQARPVLLEARAHDRLVALVSHLPHVLSFAYAQTVEDSGEAEAARALAGGSYRDLMRVSASDTALWQDIFANNRDELRAVLAAFDQALDELRRALEE